MTLSHAVSDAVSLGVSLGEGPRDAAAASHALLQARALACERGGRRLFEGLELELHGGDIVWLRGTNGRGKTSLLRLLSGLSRPAEGEVHWGLGPDAAASSEPPQAPRPCWIAHANALKEDFSALEALRFLCALAAAPVGEEAALAALARMGVSAWAAAPVRTLSQGQRRRVALARLALSMQVPLWLLDEPFDALDERGIDALKGLLREHAQAGGATLLTSHQDVGLSGLAQPPALRVREFSLDTVDTSASSHAFADAHGNAHGNAHGHAHGQAQARATSKASAVQSPAP